MDLTAVLLIIAILLLIAVLVLLVVLLTRPRGMTAQEQQAWLENRLSVQSEQFSRQLSNLREELNTANAANTRAMSDSITRNMQGMAGMMNRAETEQLRVLDNRIHNLETSNEQKLEQIRIAVNTNMEAMRAENARKLEEIRHTVDEQLQDALQKRLNESFRTVSEQLEQVYKGLGEMQNLASDVGGLKQVLSGVKTRGILGEIQLGSILEEILSPEQYATNINTVSGSTQRVEYAVKLPGADGGSVWLPIDSKFPGDTYQHLLDTYASGDAAAIEQARKALIATLCNEARDIRTKYVSPPETTNFAILFLPFEGIYAEAVNLGMIEKLQHDFQVNIAGPSTMAALLNSLQMGFRTLAIQKRSNEVWQVLSAVKTEFEKFSEALLKMQGHLRQTDEDLNRIIGTRTRAIQRKLQSVSSLDEEQAQRLLQLEDEYDG